MKRWLIRITICLVLGCVTTVGVAWSAALNGDVRRARSTLPYAMSAGGICWAYSVEQTEAITRVTYWPYARSRHPEGPAVSPDHAPRWSRLHDRNAATADPRLVYCEDSFGWPLRAMRFEYELDSRVVTDGHPIITSLRGGIRLRDHPRLFSFDDIPAYINVRALPLSLIEGGFVANALCYSAAWAPLCLSVCFAFRGARRGIRRTRGRCPKCAYQLRGQFDAGCSECGWNRPEDEQ